MRLSIVMTGVAALGLATAASAQRDFSQVEISAQEIAPGIAVLFGAGGNMAVSHGEDGTILIDDQFAPLTDKIVAAVDALGAAPVSLLVNTHYHGDHTGGNENFGKRGALIFAHHNVRARLVEGRPEPRATPPAPKPALPVVTYEQGVRFHRNGDTIDVLFVGGGHTDGDSVVFWREDNVVHMGDLYFNIPGYPYVDVDSGGNVFNAMNSLDAVIRMIDDDTVVIPGHGALSTKAELVTYRAMIGQAVARVQALRADDKTLEQALAAAPLADFDRGEGFIDADGFVTAIWRSMD